MNAVQEWPPQTSLAVAMRAYYDLHLQRLITNEAFRQIEELGNAFSVHSSSFWGYEISLSAEKKTTDFLLCIHQPDMLLQVYDGSRVPQVKKAFGKRFGGQFHHFARQWKDNSKNLEKNVSNIWFEYDCADHARAQQTPNFFLLPHKASMLSTSCIPHI